jgi:hypothetical protein
MIAARTGTTPAPSGAETDLDEMSSPSATIHYQDRRRGAPAPPFAGGRTRPALPRAAAMPLGRPPQPERPPPRPPTARRHSGRPPQPERRHLGRPPRDATPAAHRNPSGRRFCDLDRPWSSPQPNFVKISVRAGSRPQQREARRPANAASQQDPRGHRGHPACGGQRPSGQTLINRGRRRDHHLSRSAQPAGLSGAGGGSSSGQPARRSVTLVRRSAFTRGSGGSEVEPKCVGPS